MCRFWGSQNKSRPRLCSTCSNRAPIHPLRNYQGYKQREARQLPSFMSFDIGPLSGAAIGFLFSGFLSRGSWMESSLWLPLCGCLRASLETMWVGLLGVPACGKRKWIPKVVLAQTQKVDAQRESVKCFVPKTYWYRCNSASPYKK